MSPLLVVTATAALVVWFPAASRATAVIWCDPLAAVVLSQVMANGAVVSSAPRFAPSKRNWTPTTPTLSDALADTTTAGPDTVDPPAGAVIATAGAVVSLNTVTATAALVVWFPAASRATAVSACGPLGANVVSQVAPNGEVASSEPSGLPSRRNCTPTTPTLSEAFADTVT